MNLRVRPRRFLMVIGTVGIAPLDFTPRWRGLGILGVVPR